MILMIDVDDLKNINDTYGHIEGDNALKAVAAILRNACSNHKDLGNIALYRYGGDEFLMISTDWNISQTKDLWVEAIRAETEEWNKAADEAMYATKAAQKHGRS